MLWALHGAVGRSDDWSEFASSMRGITASEEGQSVREVRRLDLWRYLDCCPMSLEKVGQAMADEISRIDPAPVLVAYSMGGRLALHALLAQPQLWKAAIIVSAHTGLTDEAQRVARRQADAEWSAMALKGGWLDFLEQWNAQGVLHATAGEVEMPDRMALKSRRASVARSFVDWSLGVQQNLAPRLAEINCPVLWLSGASDEKFTAVAKSAVARIPHARHQIFAHCGHRLPWQAPQRFAAACEEFLSGL